MTKISLYVKELFVNGLLATITTAAIGIGLLVGSSSRALTGEAGR
jgi:hypothetical protein